MKTTYQGSCHCGKVKFQIDADIDHVRVCDCSICSKRGALIHRIPAVDMKIHTPLNELVLYQWGTLTARDYFCPVCGILPFRRPSDPSTEELAQGAQPFDGRAVNTRCLEGVDFCATPRKQIFGSDIPISSTSQFVVRGLAMNVQGLEVDLIVGGLTAQ